MDRVRFGRVLGRGARMAAKTVYEAVNAATAAPPSQQPTASGSSRSAAAPQVLRPRAAQPQQRRNLPQRSAAPFAGSPRRQSVFAPVKRASRAVTLEVTGSFFALFAFSFAVGIWHNRAAVSQGGPALYRFGLYCAVTLLFLYFAVSNFVRARRLQ